MKFEELLMEASQQQSNKRHDLEEGVMHLKERLEEEEAVSRTLRAAFDGSIVSLPSLSSLFLPPQFSELIQELAVVEAEILCLDRKIEELKLKLYYEQRQTQEMQLTEQKRTLARQSHVRQSTLPLRHDLHQRSLSHCYQRSTLDTASTTHSRLSFSYAPDFLDTTSSGCFTDEFDAVSRMQMGRVRKGLRLVEAKTKDDPNEVSEQLINCLIGIYLELNHVSSKTKGDVSLSRRPSSCSRKSNTYSYYQNAMNLDPYHVLQDSSGGVTRDIGPYKNFIHISRSSIDVTRFTHYCSPAVPRLSILMEKLSEVDLSFLTYKQKLAFWINIYNACIMHAFLEYGLPSSHNRLLTLMNKASLNVGGIVLNALAIEHFVLRHPCEPEHKDSLDEKETLLRHTYGLGYSEPNVTFALCRGSWSSPALRVYTAEEVVNDLGRARVEYLEASVGVSSKKKIVVPQLLQWHMKDFADDIESLLEWIYSHLPRSGNLKGMIMECLKRKAKVPLAKMVEIQTYGHEFRYLLSL
ncbi:uncharacterized protein LOC9315878 isoform X1 [Arabidopsis lyrata subsp. lyrata]|nr:uncharacterized protein LOC9315878 isoform X1 [Arabidopsis lyrata subsp. lyrata]|eukprot:XP_020884842.1 uncharacterized protein LOC9315878 isoform X1 [Arabidopsis lyrata subsp. lyrata]